MFTWIISFDSPHNCPRRKVPSYSHFIFEELKAQRRKITLPRSLVSAQLESDPESTQQRSVEVFLLLKRETAWQGPGLGRPEPHVADKKTSFWNWPKCFVVVMLEEVWTLTPPLWVSSSMRWKDGIQESQRPRWWRWEEDS